MAALFVTAGLLWLICALAYGERVPRPREIRVGTRVKIQARLHVYVTAPVIRYWFQGQIGYVEVADESGERYIRSMENVEIV